MPDDPLVDSIVEGRMRLKNWEGNAYPRAAYQAAVRLEDEVAPPANTSTQEWNRQIVGVVTSIASLDDKRTADQIYNSGITSLLRTKALKDIPPLERAQAALDNTLPPKPQTITGSSILSSEAFGEVTVTQSPPTVELETHDSGSSSDTGELTVTHEWTFEERTAEAVEAIIEETRNQGRGGWARDVVLIVATVAGVGAALHDFGLI